MDKTLLVLGGLVLFGFWALWVCCILYNKKKLPIIQDHLYTLLYKVDEECDDLSKPLRKQQVVMILRDLLGWQRVFVPPGVVSFFLTCFIWVVRKLGVPDLHKEEEVPTDGKGSV